MVLFNYSTKELTAKIVYYGPGLCGKTTNLQWVHEKLPIKNKGKMLSLATEADRTLFFDFLPIELGTIRGMKTRVQLYTVPGQVFYNATRRMVLKGADAVVFVCDSQEPMLDANIDALENLRENLEANEIKPDEIPTALQYNKRDLPNALPVEILNEKLNPRGLPYYEAVAMKGIGVEETLKGVTTLVFRALSTKYGGAAPAPGPAAAPPQAPPRAAAPAKAPPPAPAAAPPPPRPAATPPPLAASPSEKTEDVLDSLDLEPTPEPGSLEELPLEAADELGLETPPPAAGDVGSLDMEALALDGPTTKPRIDPRPGPGTREQELPRGLTVEPELSLEDLQVDAEVEAPVLEPEPPPASARRAAGPAAPLSTTVPVTVEVSSLSGQAEISIPVEIPLGAVTHEVRINLRLTLKLR